jgi:hypothetical protein
MSGTLREIRIHPAKGEPPVTLASVGVGPEGLDGDRRKGAPVHVVSVQAIRRAGEEGPRANLVIELSDDRPEGDERQWIGRELAIGEVRLLVTRAPRHCLGVYADVVTPGAVNLGDVVELRG